MAKLFGREYRREELLQRVGNLDQVAGARLIHLADGNEDDALAVLFRTGSGLSFIANANRGLDIVAAEWRGASLCWRSPTGDVNAAYFEPLGLGWLRTFYGGLLTTCGATYCGSPVEDPETIEGGPRVTLKCRGGCTEGEGGCELEWSPTGSLGLHGRFSHTPAKNLYVDGRWEGDEYVFWAQGKIREAMVFGPNVVVERCLRTAVGANSLQVRDVVTNEGWEPQEHMFLYHINLGFPVVDEGGEYVFASAEVIPRTELAAQHLDSWHQFPAPIPHEKEWVYYHRCRASADGTTYAAFVNRRFNDGQGIGVYVKYNVHQFPWLVQWKMPAQGHYVTGLEPATNLVDGRVRERQEGRLIVLEPQESREYEVEIGVLTNQAEIDAMVELIRNL
jgi:hypothetical protein